MMSLGLALLSAAFPPSSRGTAIGLFSAVTGIAVASGPIVGGAVVNGLDWTWIFWVNVPIGLIAAPLVLRAHARELRAEPRLDLPGLALVSGGALGIVWGLVRGNSAGWGSPEIVGTLALGALLIVAFVAWERRASEPMIPMSFFRSRAFSAGNLAIFMVFASLFAEVYFFSQFLQNGLGYDVLGAGLRLMPWTGDVPAGGSRCGCAYRPDRRAPADGHRPADPGGGNALDRADRRPGHGLLPARHPDGVRRHRHLDGDPVGARTRVRGVSARRRRQGRRHQHVMRELGGVFGIAVAVAVFAAAGSYATPQAFTDGFGPAVGVAAALALVGALAGSFLPAHGREARANGSPRLAGGGDAAMRRVIVRYRVKPGQADRNEQLVRAVYEELHRADPAGFRYATFRLEDGVSFVHIAESEDASDNPLPKLAAFQEFQKGIVERCDEPPVVAEATEVGSFRFGG